MTDEPPFNNFSRWKEHSYRYCIQTIPTVIPSTLKTVTLRAREWWDGLAQNCKKETNDPKAQSSSSNESTWMPVTLPPPNHRNSAHPQNFQVQQKNNKQPNGALEHHFKVAKSSLLDSFGHLWQLCWIERLFLAGCWLYGVKELYIYMLFAWHHLGGQSVNP